MLSIENPILTSLGGTKYKTTCFEIYGFDILIDQTFRPWLLEVNVSPSLSSSSPMDKYIKTLLLSDTFYLVGFRLFDRKQLEKEKAKIDKQRLLGFESSNKVMSTGPSTASEQKTVTPSSISQYNNTTSN